MLFCFVLPSVKEVVPLSTCRLYLRSVLDKLRSIDLRLSFSFQTNPKHRFATSFVPESEAWGVTSINDYPCPNASQSLGAVSEVEVAFLGSPSLTVLNMVSVEQSSGAV